MTDPKDDRRADLEAAIAEHSEPDEILDDEPAPEEDNTPEDSQESDHSQQEEPPEQPDTESDEDSRAAKPEKPKKKEKGPTAPVDWSPEDRKAFEGLPESIQRSIHQREVAINQKLQETTEARRVAEGFVKTIEPYYALIQAEGASDPLQAIGGLLQTAATLKLGSPQQKAQRIAQLVGHYGVDIETLDQALSGSLPQNNEETRLNQMLEQRLQPVNQLMQRLNQMEQAQAQQVQGRAAQDVQQMIADTQKYPHFEAARYMMADFMDMAAQQGRSMSLDEAYQQAVAYSGLQQGMMQEQNQQRLQQKQNAASSVAGRRSGGSSGAPDYSGMSLRETIAAQFAGADRI